MKNEKKELYVKIVPEKNEIVCSGLSFDDFICYLPEPIENLINIAIDTCVEVSETNYKKGFPLFEGKAAIKKNCGTRVILFWELLFCGLLFFRTSGSINGTGNFGTALLRPYV